jgi:hypothetical protein
MKNPLDIYVDAITSESAESLYSAPIIGPFARLVVFGFTGFLFIAGFALLAVIMSAPDLMNGR